MGKAKKEDTTEEVTPATIDIEATKQEDAKALQQEKDIEDCPYTLPRHYMSASQVNSYLRCGKQYYFRYILGITSPPAIQLTMGSAVHETYEPMYQSVIDGDKLWTPKQASEFGIYRLEEKASEDDLPLVGKEKDEAVTVVQNVVTSYVTNLAPHIKPLAVELEVRETLPCGVPMLAYIDQVREPSELEKAAGITDNVLVDYKVTKSKWSDTKLANEFQFNLYATITNLKTAEIHNCTKNTKKFKVNKTVEADYLLAKQDLASNLRVLRHRYPTNVGVHVNNLVESVADGISKGSFPMAPMDSWACNEKWCGYWKYCRGKKV